MNSTMKVRDFFISGVRRWDCQKVNDSFVSFDASAILAVHIPVNQCKDRVSWVYSVNGVYSVKMGYKAWHDNHGSSMRVKESDGWKKLWRADVPNKIKVFLWRFCRNSIPVRILLRERGVQTSIICSMCNDIEHMFHLFFDCPFVVECWKYMGLQYEWANEETASDWRLKFISIADHGVLVRVATILWGIWRDRNLLVWDNKVISPSVAINGASN